MSRALGRYELLRPLARGGMAEVYLARRRAAGVEKWLVVKRMRPERANDARFLDLFVREARLSMSLAHQNIVPVFDFGRIDDQVFIAMERIEGKDFGSSLTRAAQNAQPLPPVLAAFVAAECCQALDYAHRRRGPDGTALGIVHRDVTPRNVLLSWSGEVKLTDFGIASLAGEEAKVIGTPAYMAPEQARGESLDPRADVYAVGMVLREALTGMRPRPGDEREATLAAARRGELVPWPEGFTSPLVAIVDRATSLDREARFADARSMLEELDEFIVGERAQKKSDAPARKLSAWLADLWKEEREETAIDEAIEGNHLVSFLDDGALDVVGTGTMKSMAVTSSDAGIPAASGPLAAQASTSGAIPAMPAQASPSTATVASSSESAGTAEPATTSGPPRRFAVPLVLVIGGLAIGGAWLTFRSHGTGSDDQRSAASGEPPPMTSPDATDLLATTTPDANDIATPDANDLAAPADAAQHAIVVHIPPEVGSGASQHVPHLGSGAAKPGLGSAAKAVGSAAKPDTGLHLVRVGAKPWAYVTVDSDPMQYQTFATLKLTAGPHVLHFTHELITRDVKITVPDDDSLTVSQDLTH